MPDFENIVTFYSTATWEVEADPDSDDLFLPVVSDMQCSGLSSTPIAVILEHKDIGNFLLSGKWQWSQQWLINDNNIENSWKLKSDLFAERRSFNDE